VLAGNVVMTSGADRRAVADRADLDSRADTALLTGAVVVTSGKNELKGRRLWVDRKAQRMQLTAPGGRIAARFVQGADKSKDAKKAAPAAASGFATFKTDPNAPVDIDADSLDSNDAAKVATFRGNVIVKQGGFTIRTPELQATYSGEAGMADVAGTQSPATAAKPGTELTRIEAKKKVVVTSDEGQTVNGEWAIFDTKKNTVTVGGDVILAQGKNVVRGTRLVIDMASGESTIQTAAGSAAAGSAATGWAANTPSGPAGTPSQGRPSAVFYPDQLKSMRDGDKQGSGKPATGDAWRASTTSQSSGQGGH
jgi:lipopolysaccharide export system protein LptA